MSLFNKLALFLLLVGFCSPSFAAINGVDQVSCGVFSNADEDGKKEQEEEEPDCE